MEYHRQKSLKLRKGISVAGFWNLELCFGRKMKLLEEVHGACHCLDTRRLWKANVTLEGF